MSRPTPPPTKFFLEDIIRRTNGPAGDPQDAMSMVVRHWHNSDPATALDDNDDPLTRSLAPGEIGISNLLTGVHEIIREDDCTLVDRSMQRGDLVKRSIHDVISGVVVGASVEVQVEHAVSMDQYSGWIASDDLENAMDLYIGDFVIYDDWVGQVEELIDEVVAELSDTGLFTFAEPGGRYQVGDRGVDILPDHCLQHLRSISTASPKVIVSVQPRVMAVAWLALNQMLDPRVSDLKKRPKTFWTGDEFKQLCIVRPYTLTRLSDRVRFKNASLAAMHGIRTTRHGRPGVGHGLVESDLLIVRKTRTTVDVLWQDGTVTKDLPSTQVIPYTNPDEYDCWPGDHVIFKNEYTSEPVVVRSVDAADRTAIVFRPDSDSSSHSAPPFEQVSVLELDPHGPAPLEGDLAHVVGARRGDFVFIHESGKTNGLPKPHIPKIGEVEEWARDPDPYGWRQEMATVGMEYGQRLEEERTARQNAEVRGERPPQFRDDKIVWKNPAVALIDWFGEVSSLEVSGLVNVSLPTGDIVQVPVERLTILNDGRDAGGGVWMEAPDGADEDEWEDEEEPMVTDASVGPGSLTTSTLATLGQFFGFNTSSFPPGTSQNAEMGSEGGWEDGSEAMDVDDDVPPLIPISDVSLQVNHPDEDVASSTLTSSSPARTVAPTSDQTQSPPPDTSRSHEHDSEDEVEHGLGTSWQKFKMMPNAPRDHAFLSRESRGQPSRQFLAKISKEYRLLTTTLPDSIAVIAYEDRTNLLRSLIIGPQNTPYEGAPFVIDWFLEDTFPQTPPIAHFHSWTNGNGRVNPNLYEEGKVCLSILGTWAGDKSECWNPVRSSLMQALVSIQGLVLVKEPWFCEPAFERLRGTPEGIVNSRLYNEKAYVLSRGFVRRALEQSPEGFRKELEWYYFDEGHLKSVLQSARALIEGSQKTAGASTDAEAEMMRTVPGWEDKAVPKLTNGGILPLQRTLTRLDAILVAGKQA